MSLTYVGIELSRVSRVKRSPDEIIKDKIQAGNWILIKIITKKAGETFTSIIV